MLAERTWYRHGRNQHKKLRVRILKVLYSACHEILFWTDGFISDSFKPNVDSHVAVTEIRKIIL